MKLLVNLIFIQWNNSIIINIKRYLPVVPKTFFKLNMIVFQRSNSVKNHTNDSIWISFSGKKLLREMLWDDFRKFENLEKNIIKYKVSRCNYAPMGILFFFIFSNKEHKICIESILYCFHLSFRGHCATNFFEC